MIWEYGQAGNSRKILRQVFNEGLRDWTRAIAGYPVEPLEDLRFPDLAQYAGEYNPVLIQERCRRDRFAQAESRKIVARGADPDRECDLMRREKFRDARAGLFFVERCTEKDDSLGGICLLHLRHQGHFFLTRTAPGSPEIEHHYFAPVVAQMHALALKRNQVQIRGRVLVRGNQRERDDKDKRTRCLGVEAGPFWFRQGLPLAEE
jgi:hypothetical protein